MCLRLVVDMVQYMVQPWGFFMMARRDAFGIFRRIFINKEESFLVNKGC
jgi:hypothetical protein